MEIMRSVLQMLRNILTSINKTFDNYFLCTNNDCYLSLCGVSDTA